MKRTVASDLALRSAISAVRDVRRTLESLVSRLRLDSIGAGDEYLDALETAEARALKLIELLESRSKAHEPSDALRGSDSQ